MVLPAIRDLNIYQGDTFSLDLRLRQKTLDGSTGAPIDLTGCTVQSQIRATADSATVAADLEGTLGDSAGTVHLELAPVDTAHLAPGVWDMQITFPDGAIKTYLKGGVYVTKQVTR